MECIVESRSYIIIEVPRNDIKHNVNESRAHSHVTDSVNESKVHSQGKDNVNESKVHSPGVDNVNEGNIHSQDKDTVVVRKLNFTYSLPYK